MSDLYPLLMQPLFDPRPWGTLDLSPIYSQRFAEKIGESWLTGDHCKIQNGPLAGQSLADVSSQYQRELVGDAPAGGARFPLLAKFLFPQEKLSVQVHPDDDDARAIGQPWGKTECGYAAQADAGAQLGLGLKPGATPAEFERSIRENRAQAWLNWRDVFAGSMVCGAGGSWNVQGADCEPVSFGKGDAIVVPACISEFRVQPQPGVKFLKSYVPGERVPEPEIRID